ncbi:hypothetical protein B6U93_01335 [Candidatus Woesearchaeota archaeon ex4484_78]|nr:MAG: hypothetical protein B6U93_01335 [Candidatus Woesearchaeota archaeon ex4484_78]
MNEKTTQILLFSIVAIVGITGLISNFLSSTSISGMQATAITSTELKEGMKCKVYENTIYVYPDKTARFLPKSYESIFECENGKLKRIRELVPFGGNLDRPISPAKDEQQEIKQNGVSPSVRFPCPGEIQQEIKQNEQQKIEQQKIKTQFPKKLSLTPPCPEKYDIIPEGVPCKNREVYLDGKWCEPKSWQLLKPYQHSEKALQVVCENGKTKYRVVKK